MQMPPQSSSLPTFRESSPRCLRTITRTQTNRARPNCKRPHPFVRLRSTASSPGRRIMSLPNVRRNDLCQPQAARTEPPRRVLGTVGPRAAGGHRRRRRLWRTSICDAGAPIADRRRRRRRCASSAARDRRCAAEEAGGTHRCGGGSVGGLGLAGRWGVVRRGVDGVEDGSGGGRRGGREGGRRTKTKDEREVRGDFVPDANRLPPAARLPTAGTYDTQQLKPLFCSRGHFSLW